MSADGPPVTGSYPEAPPTPSLVGQVLDGRYRIVKQIGEGGMGEVYAAEHVHIEKKFAIKLLKAEIVSNPEAVTRFRQEARSSSSIGHRNIIAIEDFGQLQDGRIYMCMELLNGAALNDMITQPMPADRLLNILIQTGHGLAAAHAKGIVHRDMKPENIFVTIGPNGEDIPKLLDFGIAKVSGNDGQNHLTRTGTIFGTPFYMAPEQALGNPVDARTDIYAMGVIMYECFSGSLPFQGESFMGILTQHITTPAEPVTQRAIKAGRPLPMGVAEIITKCMEKDPNLRYRTMDELVSALVSVYRGIAGPGMSTYMEAFPVGSPNHMQQPTPGPMQPPGMPMTGGYHAPTPMPHQIPQQSSGQMPGPSGYAAPGPSGGYDPGMSGLAVAKKSNKGVIIAILAVLVVGGGIAAFAVLNKGDDGKAANGSGSGSGSGSAAVAVGSGSGSSVVETPPTSGSGSGSAAVAQTGSGSGSGSATVDVGSGSGSAAAPAMVTVKVTTSPFADQLAVYALDGTKIDDGQAPAEVPVPPGGEREVIVKVKGFKDRKVLLSSKKPDATVKIDAVAGVHRPPPPPPPPGHQDCANAVKDPKDPRCKAEYCSHHPDDMNCELQ